MQQGETEKAASSVAKAATFLFIATRNAFDQHRPAVRDAAQGLDNLAREIRSGEVTKASQLRPVFAKAHFAMSGHHLAKAVEAITAKRWSVAIQYSRSAATHLQRAAYWSDQTLAPESEDAIEQVQRQSGQWTESSGRSVEQAGKLLEQLGQRIERFGKRMAEASNNSEKE
jgi:hypothetical protein